MKCGLFGRRFFFLIAAGALASAAPASGARILISGNAMYAGSNFDSAIQTLGDQVTYVDPQDFGTVDLSGYNMVYLDGFSQFSPGTPGNPGLVAQTLNDFMAAGGSVLVQNPGFGSDALSLYPSGGELSASYTYPPGENTIRITDSSSYLNAGLTDAGLSGWNASAYGIFTDIGSFHGVTDNGTAGDWITIEKGVGAGHLIYTEQGFAQRLSADPSDAQALGFLANATPVPEPATLTVFALALPFLRRRRRS